MRRAFGITRLGRPSSQPGRGPVRWIATLRRRWPNARFLREVARDASTLIRAGRNRPIAGGVDFGDLRRLAPISRSFGHNRGTPVDRHYIERFLAAKASRVRGRVLEIGGNEYTRRFGAGRVSQSDILHVDDSNPAATYVGDLASATHIPSGAFECVILTQTLQLINEAEAALATVHRILSPGGVLLATMPGLSQISEIDPGYIWRWAFTAQAVRDLVGEHFRQQGAVEVASVGNFLTTTAFLYGIATEELTPEELAHHDPAVELLITVTATKARQRDGEGVDGGMTGAGLESEGH